MRLRFEVEAEAKAKAKKKNQDEARCLLRILYSAKTKTPFNFSQGFRGVADTWFPVRSSLKSKTFLIKLDYMRSAEYFPSRCPRPQETRRIAAAYAQGLLLRIFSVSGYLVNPEYT